MKEKDPRDLAATETGEVLNRRSPEAAGAAEATAPPDPPSPPEAPPAVEPPPPKVNRRELLARLQEKNQAIFKLTKSKAALEAESKDFRDKWLRSAAELENYRKRTAKEWELLREQTKAEVILEVLKALDDFERAFAVMETDEQTEFVRGIRLIYNNLLQALQKFGVREIRAQQAPFDPSLHMAIGQTESTDVASGAVAQVVEKGYYLNDTVIRPAKVIVAK